MTCPACRHGPKVQITKRKKRLPQQKPKFTPSREYIERMKALIRAENEAQKPDADMDALWASEDEEADE